MIDMTKQYTYNGRPVRIYADGSDTDNGYIHAACLHKYGCYVPFSCKESELVEVWEPKEGEWCYFWDNNTLFSVGVVGKYADINGKYTFRLPNGDSGGSYKYCAPFTGELPKEFKGLV